MKKHLPWFKHYANASSGETLTLLWSQGDIEAVALFWVILEMVAKHEDREKAPGECTINWRVLGRETFWKPSKCRRVLSRISAVSQIQTAEKPGGNVWFLIPNWLKFQETRGGKRVANEVSKRPTEERGERREERSISIKAISVAAENQCTSAQAPRAEFDFEKLYEKYPRKMGKKKGMIIAKREIKTEKQYQQLAKAIENYAVHCKIEKVEPKYTKQFCTFMGSWCDWVDFKPPLQTPLLDFSLLTG